MRPRIVADAAAGAAAAADASKARFLEFFHRSRVPMLLVDDRRRYCDANAACRLLFRMPRAQITALSIEREWQLPGRTGTLSGPYETTLPDGTRLSLVYTAISEVVPGCSLIAMLPADWPEDELELAESASETSHLSPREREIVRDLAAGRSVDEIAAACGISRSTVKTHVLGAMHKLHARNRTHLIAIAIRRGLID